MSFDTFGVSTIEDLHKVIKELPDDMGVEIADGVSLTAETVRELRELGSLGGHEKLRILIPRPRYPESMVIISLPD
jgi:hypothetical protein